MLDLFISSKILLESRAYVFHMTDNEMLRFSTTYRHAKPNLDSNSTKRVQIWLSMSVKCFSR